MRTTSARLCTSRSCCSIANIKLLIACFKRVFSTQKAPEKAKMRMMGMKILEITSHATAVIASVSAAIHERNASAR